MASVGHSAEPVSLREDTHGKCDHKSCIGNDDLSLPSGCVADDFGFAFVTIWLEGSARTTLIGALFGQIVLVRSDFG